MSKGNHRTEILIVDDSPSNLALLSALVSSRGYTVRPALNGRSAIRAVEQKSPDLILLDVTMPDIDGFEVCAHLKSDETSADIPIIFISGRNDVADKVKAFRIGGVDYISKPFHGEEVLARIENQLTVVHQQKRINALNDLILYKDELVRILSHDLKNPINAILGYTALLVEHDAEDAESRDLAQSIRRAAESMHHLVRDLLELAQIEERLPLKLVSRSLDSLLLEHLERQRGPARDKGITLNKVAFDDFEVRVDPLRFGQVVANLLGNAVKYTPRGGTVTVDVEANSSHVLLRVKDDGPGIPADDLSRIFEKFYRSPHHLHSAEGTGLGLAIAKAIMELHGGDLIVESKVGEGTTFSALLPL